MFGTTMLVSAHAQDYHISIEMVGNTPGCQLDDSCYVQSNITISQYDTVIWINNNNYSHTITSGKITDGMIGELFDSGLVDPGKSYSHTFVESGVYEYFSVLQPWMSDSITVESAPKPSDLSAIHVEPTCGDGTIRINGICQAAVPASEGYSLEESSLVLQTDPEPVMCGSGTVPVNGICVVKSNDNGDDNGDNNNGGGCLIATATYGTELSPQVQLLREIRDNALLQTESGKLFMNSFNDVYYSFSPGIADAQRENLLFRESVKLFITPMISSLSVMGLADGTENSVLGLGISVITLNLGMYVAVPALIGFKVHKYNKSRHS